MDERRASFWLRFGSTARADTPAIISPQSLRQGLGTDADLTRVWPKSVTIMQSYSSCRQPVAFILHGPLGTHANTVVDYRESDSSAMAILMPHTHCTSPGSQVGKFDLDVQRNPQEILMTEISRVNEYDVSFPEASKLGWFFRDQCQDWANVNKRRSSDGNAIYVMKRTVIVDVLAAFFKAQPKKTLKCTDLSAGIPFEVVELGRPEGKLSGHGGIELMLSVEIASFGVPESHLRNLLPQIDEADFPHSPERSGAGVNGSDDGGAGNSVSSAIGAGAGAGGRLATGTVGRLAAGFKLGAGDGAGADAGGGAGDGSGARDADLVREHSSTEADVVPTPSGEEPDQAEASQDGGSTETSQG